MNEVGKIMYDGGLLALYSIFTIQTLDWIGILQFVSEQMKKDSSTFIFVWLAEALVLAYLSWPYF